MSPQAEHPWTPAELKLMIIGLKHMSNAGIGAINFETVASEYGYKDSKIARQKFLAAKAKVKAIRPVEAQSKSTVSKDKDGDATKSFPTTRKRKTEESNGDTSLAAQESSEEEYPKKMKKEEKDGHWTFSENDEYESAA